MLFLLLFRFVLFRFKMKCLKDEGTDGWEGEGEGKGRE